MNLRIDLCTGLGLFALVAIAWAGFLLKNYLPAYLDEKGRNLAKKEDIAVVTREIERIRSEYGVLLEELKARHQLRLAAIDRRLQAHQEAITLWRDLIRSPEECGKAVIACQDWWEKNCLYLEPSVREAFVVAYFSAQSHPASKQKPDAAVTEIKEEWNKVMAFPGILFAAIQLPGLSEIEAKVVQPSAQPLTHT